MRNIYKFCGLSLVGNILKHLPLCFLILNASFYGRQLIKKPITLENFFGISMFKKILKYFVVQVLMASSKVFFYGRL